MTFHEKFHNARVNFRLHTTGPYEPTHMLVGPEEHDELREILKDVPLRPVVQHADEPIVWRHDPPECLDGGKFCDLTIYRISQPGIMLAWIPKP